MNRHLDSGIICLIVVIIIVVAAVICPASEIGDRVLRSIMDSGQYYFGEGHGQTEDDARRQAKVTLLESISVAISSKTIDVTQEVNFEVSENYENILTTYSSLSLQNLQTRIEENRDGWYAISYISKTDLEASFYQAKQKVRDMVKLALQAESEGRIGDALKMLYWAYLLTHTYCGELNLEFEGIDVLDARLAISEKMIRIIKNISVTAEPCYRKAGSVNSTLSFYYNDKPIQNLEFGYQCGEGDEFGYIDNGSSETITLYHDINSRTYPLWISIEYIYLGQMRRKPEILNLYEIFKNKEFDLSICVELTAPWVAGKKEKKKPVVIPPPPVKTGFSTTIEILADIKEKSEFDEALHDYNRSGKIIIARERSSIPSGNNIFVVILDETKKKELLFLTNGKYQSVKTRKIYSDYHDAYTGDAMVIWLGEPIR